MNKSRTYNLYIDECGDSNLATYDPNFPIFTLCGILIPESNLNSLASKFNQLKNDFWQSTDIILHSRDIRKCEKQFQILFNKDIKQNFYRRINQILSLNNLYFVVCCSVLKEKCINKYGIDTDIYGTALKYVIQRSIFCIDEISPAGGKIDIIVERRGKKEDAALLKYYNGLRVTGMHYISPERLKEHSGNFDFSHKKDNVIGLQIADLIAYPISRYVMNSTKFNPAFEIIVPNIFKSNGKLLGLKIFPDK